MPRAGNVRHEVGDTRWPTREEAARSRLFSPLRVGRLALAARTWVPAMVPWRALESGEATDALYAWYARFAAGRPGALVVEATGIRDVPSGPLLRIGHPRFEEGLRKLVDVVREASGGQTRLFIQLIDFLAVRRRPPPEKFFGRYLDVTTALRDRLAGLLGDDSIARGGEALVRSTVAQLSASDLERVLGARDLEALRFGYRERVTDTHLPHIADLPSRLPDLFAQAALRAERVGFDGVELHFAHAYTMASFLSRLNDRADGYGGSREARLRLPLEVFDACRAAVRSPTVVGCRFLVDEVIDGGSRVEDAAFYATGFAAAGMDYLSLSKGGKFEDARQPRIGQAVYPYTGLSGHECMPTIYSDERGPFGRQLPLTKIVREAVRGAGYGVPIVAAGGLNTFEIAERALVDGACDMVASARQSLADPDWFEKVRQGRGASVRRCSMTNYCEGLDQQHKQVTCRLWDRVDLADAPLVSLDGKRRLVAPQ